MEPLTQWLRSLHTLFAPDPVARSGPEDYERGDVPGWVMITLMTAALVAVIWAIAQDQLTAILQRAFDAVGGI